MWVQSFVEHHLNDRQQMYILYFVYYRCAHQKMC